MSRFFSRHKQTIVALLVGFLYSATIAFATPPGSPYSAGETLDPSCIPGATNCTVTISAVGIPGGATTQIQFNDAGLLAGSSSFVWDKTTNRLGIGDSTPAASLTVGASDAFQVTDQGRVTVGRGSSDPTGSAGSLYYRTDSDTLRLYDTTWQDIPTNTYLGTNFYNKDELSTDGSSSVSWTNITNAPTIAANSDTQLLNGGQVSYVSGYSFNVSASSYKILGTTYNSVETPVTLGAADPTFDRIDVIAVNTSGNTLVIAGTPSASPQKPYVDPDTQLELTFITVGANTMAPSITELSLYAENAGSPTEWNRSSNNAAIVLNSTASPRNGTTNIEGTSVPANARLTFTPSTPFDINSTTQLVLYIKSKAAWGNNRKLSLAFANATGQKGNAISINRTGSFGFDSTSTAAYQQVVIPISNFAVPSGTLITQMTITALGNQGTHGFYIDDLSLEAGTPLVSTNSFTVTSANSSSITITGNGLVSNPLTASLNNTYIDANYFKQNGNAFSGLATLGTTDNNALAFKTNNLERLRITTTGRMQLTNTNNNVLLGGGNDTMTGANNILLGTSAGTSVTTGTDNFFAGTNAGSGVLATTQSNFIGYYVGELATNAQRSNFIGYSVGAYATNASYSNFLGYQTGILATNAVASNFFGYYTGRNATNASNSNFFGDDAGFSATNASNSNFFGYYSGYQASNASYSNLLGYQTGKLFSGNNIGSNNIIIGTNISLPNATANSINLGGVLFGSGTYATTTGNPSITAVSGGRIGIGVVSPTATLDVAGDVKSSGLVTGQTLAVTGVTSATIPAPTGATAAISYGPLGYEAFGLASTYRVYSYKNTPTGRIYSSTYAESNTVTDDSSTNDYTVSVSWTPAAGVDGYRILLNEPNYNGYTYNAGYDTVSSSFVDDACILVCFRSASSSVTPIEYFTNNSAVNGSLTLSEPLYVGGMSFKGDTNLNIAIGSGNGSPITTYGYQGRSVLIGIDAGKDSTYGQSSVFIGWSAGASATNAEASNFIGTSSGQSATSATYSNFFGNAAGFQATNANRSNFLGKSAGMNATSANNSNFFGDSTGFSAVSANNSNFFGYWSGRSATNASYSNFLGYHAGYAASNSPYSNIFGYQAGKWFTANLIGANNIIIGTNISLPNAAANSINIGGVLFGTGTYATTTGNPSITAVSTGKIGVGIVSPAYRFDVLQNSTAQTATNRVANISNASSTFDTTAGALSSYGGYFSSTSTRSAGANDLTNVGLYATASGAQTNLAAHIDGTLRLKNTDIQEIGTRSISIGAATPSVIDSFFVGQNAGLSATNAGGSNFLGLEAGRQATNANDSNFFGMNAGYQATNASYSNFIGQSAGESATSANGSNFIGDSSGRDATNASYSNFIGVGAGGLAVGASNSNFFGQNSGYEASNASYSNLFGYQAGKFYTGNNIGSNNIIIGTNISLPDTTANSINIGGVLFGSGTYATTTGNPSITAVTAGKIGIAVINPTYTLQVGNSSVTGIVSRFENSTGTCDINPTTTTLSCSSDLTLKKNITTINTDAPFILRNDLASTTYTKTLNKIMNLTPVVYNWNTETDTDNKHAGFIAQEVEQLFPDLVTTDPVTGLKSLGYTGLIPYTIAAIQELGIEVEGMNALEEGTTLRVRLISWFADLENGITSLFAKEIKTEKLCITDSVGEVCITKDQLYQMVQDQTTQPSGGSSSTNETQDPVIDAPVPEEVVPVVEPVIEPEPVIDTPIQEEAPVE